ncbi:MAG: PAS-domain containing protein [Rhodospirillales bacterium]
MPNSIGNVFEIALDNVDQGVVVYDKDLIVLGYNRRFLEILDMPPDQFAAGDPFSKWVRFAADQGSYRGQGTADERYEERMAIARTFAPYRVHRHRYNGRIVEVVGRPLANGCFVTTYSDITERVQAEKAAQESQQRFRDFAELGSDWFWEMGPDLKFSYHSQRYFEITGFRPEDKIGTSRTRYVDPASMDADKAKWANHMADLEARRPFRNFEYGFSAHDGKSILARISGTPVFGPAGKFLGYRGIGTDITDMKEAQIALIAAKSAAETAMAEAESANRGKSDFLAAMSHDLRTPLNAIIGFADAISLQYFGAINDRYQEYANDIRWSGEHLLSLIGDILDVTAIEAGMLSTNKQDVQIAEVVEECRLIIKSEARSLGVDVVVKIPGDLPPAHADKQAVKKIILNLLANAIKFTPRDGCVTLSAEATDESHILKVSDTGIGIPENKIALITDPFVKGVSDPYQSQDGVGLGLAIVKSLVQAHDGTLDIKSKPGKGTTVMVTLPRR